MSKKTFFRVKPTAEDIFKHRSFLMRFLVRDRMEAQKIERLVRLTPFLTLHTLETGEKVVFGKGVCACDSLEELVSHIKAVTQSDSYWMQDLELIQFRGDVVFFYGDEGCTTFLVKPSEVLKTMSIPHKCKKVFLLWCKRNVN